MLMQDIKTMTEKHAPASQAISMAMRIRRYGAKHIAQYGRSRAVQTGVLPRIAPVDAMVINFGKKNQAMVL